MLLVPRQLLRSGMTGNVPYYGGRFTPAQAMAAAHPTARAPVPPSGGRVPLAPASRPSPAPAPRPERPATSPAEKGEALRRLLDSGVLTAEEYDDLLTRIDP